MIIWWLSDNKNAKIGDEYYKEYDFYFDLEIVIFCTPNNVS